jgi:hypothetical protein
VVPEEPHLLAPEGGEFEEALMKLRLRLTADTLVLLGFVSCASAQDKTHESTNASLAETLRPVLTGKERLGPKWTDEQRIDNCHVPVDKRGTKPRSSACPHSPSS